MSDVVYKVSLHYAANEMNLPDSRERVEQAINAACAHLERYANTRFVGYRINEAMDLGDTL